ncbi:sulfurtransferase complex subunit TusB [Parahaliea mediterranea]|uniref:sulfurtransferase complex subunit TusB n=1 Tax=Parahaliea mediterranea TaxID=651086 RepID=UPI000E2FE438|nr:sulfurtransferase complex subunit TusB [Parahaliea mediterranea]
MILHTLSAAPDTPAFQHCLAQLQAADALLLMGNGVYAALVGAPAGQALGKACANLYVLDDDARTAGVAAQLGAGVTPVDFDGFVALSERYQRQIAWY